MKASELAKILMITPDLEVICQEGIVDTVELFIKGDYSNHSLENVGEKFSKEVEEDFLVIRSKKIETYE
jgi:hypothetical protein